MNSNHEIFLYELASRTQFSYPDPKSFPERKLPKILRKIFQYLLLPFVLLDSGAGKIAKLLIRPPFIREGACKKRGNCCRYILFPEIRGIFGKVFVFWATELHGFYPRKGEEFEKDGKTVFIYGCRHLQENGSCGNYRFRPKVCREWPSITGFFRPKILKGCGYRVKVRPSYKKKYPGLKIYEED